MAIVQVGKSGKAEKGLAVGTTVKTAGGDYNITGVNPDGTYKSTKINAPTPTLTGGFNSKVPTGMTMASYGNQIAQQTYGASAPVAQSSASPIVSAPTTKNPAEMVAGNIQFFGSPEAYAQKIIEKEASGQTLSDPNSASLFKQQNPHLFPGEQKKNILQQLQQFQQQPVSVEQLPEFGVMQNVAKQRGDIASRQAMETLNQRGILNSTITADNVAQIQQQAQTEILPVLLERAYGLRKDQAAQLMQLLQYYSGEEKAQFDRQQTVAKAKAESDAAAAKLALDKKEKEVKRALDEIKEFKYVTNYASKVLGIPVNTKTADALKIAHDMEMDIQRVKISQGQLSVSQGQLGVAQGNLEVRRQESAQKSSEDIARKDSADNYGAAFEELDKLSASTTKKSDALGWLKQNKTNFNDTDYKSLVNYINGKDSPFE